MVADVKNDAIELIDDDGDRHDVGEEAADETRKAGADCGEGGDRAGWRARALVRDDERAEGWLNEAEARRGVNVGAVTRSENVDTERLRTEVRVGVESRDERRDAGADSDWPTAAAAMAARLVDVVGEHGDENETRGVRSSGVAFAWEKATGGKERAEWLLAALCWCLAADEMERGEGMWKA